MTGRELWFVRPGHVELRVAPARMPQPGEARARALASGLSQGTELLLFKGEGPEPFDPSLDSGGSSTYPRRYGYAWVGEICESLAAELPLGARVFALAPHGDFHTAPSASFRRLSEDVPSERAVLAANLETAVNVTWDGAIALGDHVLVVGGGVVGLLCGFAAKRGGASQVVLLEPSARRREAALRLGFDAALAPDDAARAGVADVVIEASGNPACLDAAIARARFEGVIVVASFYGQRTAALALGAEFHRRRLTLRSSQVSALPASRCTGWSFDRRFELVCELLREPVLDLLLEPSLSFAQAPRVYDALASAPGDRLQTVFRYAT
jgi:2-desacetyl-2-hydroxyethyl bacteriochlorophyllide A dehydrogenase